MNKVKSIFAIFAIIIASVSMAAPINDMSKTTIEISNFEKDLVNNYKFKHNELTTVLHNAKFNDKILNAITHPAEDKTYDQYHNIFVTPKRVNLGEKFYTKNYNYLHKVAKHYGVSPEIIVAIIGVESNYGKNTSQYKTLDSLYTLAFFYPQRATFFRYELAQFLLLCRDLGLDPNSVYGSYAGALGVPQFMPSSYRHFSASKLGTNHKPNLFDNNFDSITSIANFLNHYGWVTGDPAIITATNPNKEVVKTLKVDKVYKVAELKSLGFTIKELNPTSKVKILLVDDKHPTTVWLGLANSNAILHYNKSKKYAIIVNELADEIKSKYSSQKHV